MITELFVAAGVALAIIGLRTTVKTLVTIAIRLHRSNKTSVVNRDEPDADLYEHIHHQGIHIDEQ